MIESGGALAPVIPLHSPAATVTRPREPWLSKREVAQHFSVSTKTIERWMREARYFRGGRPLPFEKLYEDGGVRFKLSACEAWYAEALEAPAQRSQPRPGHERVAALEQRVAALEQLVQHLALQQP